MGARRKYTILISAAAIVFFALLSTEGADRARELLRFFSELQEKEATLLPPDKVLEKKAELLARKQMLTSLLSSQANAYEHDEGGVFEFVSANARHSSVHLQAVMPGTSQEHDQIAEIAFTLELEAPYHRVAEFLNALETGEFLVSIRKITLSREGRATALRGSVAGVAYVPAGRHGR